MNFHDVKIQVNGYDYFIDPDDLKHTAKAALKAAYQDGQDDENDATECYCTHEDFEDDCPVSSVDAAYELLDYFRTQLLTGGTLADLSPLELLEEFDRRLGES